MLHCVQGVGAQLLADAATRSVLNVSAWVLITVDAEDGKLKTVLI
jgi:hypothetical protein